MTTISIYRQQWHLISHFTPAGSIVITQICQDTPTCFIGDFNEELLLGSNKTICNMFASYGFQQHVKKPIWDSGDINWSFLFKR